MGLAVPERERIMAGGGMVARYMQGDRNRKPRDHFLNHKYKREKELEVSGKIVNSQNPSQVIYLFQRGVTPKDSITSSKLGTECSTT